MTTSESVWRSAVSRSIRRALLSRIARSSDTTSPSSLNKQTSIRRRDSSKPVATGDGEPRRSPSGTYAERLAELSSILERLVRVMQATYVPVWIRKPVALLDDDKPLGSPPATTDVFRASSPASNPPVAT